MKMILLLSSYRKFWPAITVFLVGILSIVNSEDLTEKQLDQLEFQFYNIFENDDANRTLEDILIRNPNKFSKWCNKVAGKAKCLKQEATEYHKIYRKKRPREQGYILLKTVKCVAHDDYPYEGLYSTFYLIPKEKEFLYIFAPFYHENTIRISNRISYK